MKINTFDKKIRHKKRVRQNVMGSDSKPRISVFRSNRYTYVQAINDEKRTTIAAFSSLMLKKDKEYKKGPKLNESRQVGMNLAKLLKDKKIEMAVYDRNYYIYKGRVRAVAEGLREGGIKI